MAEPILETILIRLSIMIGTRHFTNFVLGLAFLFFLAACGSDATSTAADAGAAVSDDTSASTEEDEDHDDEDHDDDDEDHDDDDEDHDDEDHDHDEEGTEAGLGAHEHGTAELTVAWSGGDLIIDLISPAVNIFGFETEPSTDEEIEFAADRTAALTAPGVLVINSEAGCNLVGEAETDFVVEGSHAEVTASWTYVCDSPEDINQLDAAALFAEFPNMEDVDAQRASDSGQSAAELSPTDTVFALQ